ncbi:hypothetical protein MTY_1912 [Moorella thermoacetica Y72]|uniref:Uncharacterized protein n=1 Tax=Moorella thermoacetica Y72 TaxID=1325331 RepID=A0A0S6UGJ0_NEOTH|nr:hypothetical protein MTY_1912 [Moorella thermoacetica Y72]
MAMTCNLIKLCELYAGTTRASCQFEPPAMITIPASNIASKDFFHRDTP